MFLMCMVTFTGSPPGLYIKIFSSGKPVHATFFWSSRYKFKHLARASIARSIRFFPESGLFMFAEKMSTETFGGLSHSETFAFFHFTGVGDVGFSHDRFLSMVEFLLHYFSRSLSGSMSALFFFTVERLVSLDILPKTDS